MALKDLTLIELNRLKVQIWVMCKTRMLTSTCTNSSLASIHPQDLLQLQINNRLTSEEWTKWLELKSWTQNWWAQVGRQINFSISLKTMDKMELNHVGLICTVNNNSWFPREILKILLSLEIRGFLHNKIKYWILHRRRTMKSVKGKQKKQKIAKNNNFNHLEACHSF